MNSNSAKKEFKLLESGHFSFFKRGDIIFIYNHNSIFSFLTSIKARKDSKICNATHVERYLGNGLAISQDWKIRCHSIKDFFNGKYDIFLFSNSHYNSSIRNALVAESIVYYGLPYDVPGILGQALSFFTGIEAFEYLINARSLFYCSEFIFTVENFVLQSSLSSLPLIDLRFPSTPDDLFDYFSMSTDKGWNCTFQFIS